MAKKSEVLRLTTKLQEPKTRYVPIRCLAVGGMAEVWEGKATTSAGDSYAVAIKRIKPELTSQPIYGSMFRDEARLGMLLKHPNIVRVYDAREIGGTFIMIMELVQGASLQGILARAQERGAGMPVGIALWVARAIASGLDYAHRATGAHGEPLGVLHRDVSPHNVLLGIDGAVKLLDFGLSDAALHRTQLQAGVAGGKLGYLAPEVIQERPIGPAVDCFALGVVLWEALAGRRLFLGSNDADTVNNVLRAEVPDLRKFNFAVPHDVESLVQSILRRDPSSRMGDAAQIVRELDALLVENYSDVGDKDVALITSMHMATMASLSLPPKEVLERLEDELETFAVYAEEEEVAVS